MEGEVPGNRQADAMNVDQINKGLSREAFDKPGLSPTGRCLKHFPLYSLLNSVWRPAVTIGSEVVAPGTYYHDSYGYE